MKAFMAEARADAMKQERGGLRSLAIRSQLSLFDGGMERL